MVAVLVSCPIHTWLDADGGFLCRARRAKQEMGHGARGTGRRHRCPARKDVAQRVRYLQDGTRGPYLSIRLAVPVPVAAAAAEVASAATDQSTIIRCRWPSV